MGCCLPSRYILALIVLSTTVTVLVCVGSGLVLLLAPGASFQFNGGNFTRVPAAVLLLSGLLAILAGFLGCCALSRDSRCALLLFSVLAVLMAMVEVGAAGTVFGFMYEGEIEDQMAGQLHAEMNRFARNSSSSVDTVNKLQSQLHCCGIHTYADWWNRTSWKRGSDLAPQSCCSSQYSHLDNCAQASNMLYSQGCLDVLVTRLKLVVDCALAAVLIAAVLQVVTASFGCFGAALIKRYRHYAIL